jgi:MFS transporter, DHA3 family, tetracycline resistance protein
MTDVNTASPAPKWSSLMPLRQRDDRLLIGSVALSIFGIGMWTIVMTFQVLAVDDRPAALSAVAACLSAGLFAFAVVGAVAADRFSHRKIIIGVQLVNTVAIGGVALLAMTGLIQLWHLAVAAAVLGGSSALLDG